MPKAIPSYPNSVPGQKILSPVCHRFSASIRRIQRRDKFLYQELDQNRAKLRSLMLAESGFRPGQTVRHRRDRVVGRVVRVEFPSFAEGDAELGLYVHEQLPSGRFSRRETWWFSWHVDIVEPEKAPRQRRALAAA
jgi:hypothetical protein